MLARVWNDNDKPYTEMFRDERITIEAKGYIEMDKSDAIMFMGQWVPIKKHDNGQVLNPKRLRLEVVPLKTPVVEKKLCQMCQEEFQTDKELALHSELNHAEAMVDDDARKQAAKRNK